MIGLFDRTFTRLAESLDFRSRRHQVILSNVTNLETPGYKPAEISFRQDLEGELNHRVSLATTAEGHLTRNPVNGASYEYRVSDEKPSLDREMGNLAENHLMYNATVEMLSRKFRHLSMLLREVK